MESNHKISFKYDILEIDWTNHDEMKQLWNKADINLNFSENLLWMCFVVDTITS